MAAYETQERTMLIAIVMTYTFRKINDKRPGEKTSVSWKVP